MPERSRGEPAIFDARRAMRLALERLEPGLHFLAEDVLALHTRIDWVAVDESRSLVAILVADRGADARALALALAHREWLHAHLPDWLKLAPELGADPGADVRALVVADRFEPETEAAAATLPRGWIELVRTRPSGGGDARTLELERLEPSRSDACTPSGAPGPGRPARRTAPPFRSGLTAEDLGLSEDESAHFD